MATVFIFHGIYGNPDENWFPWMKRELEAKGLTVIVPAFPNPDRPVLDDWLQHMARYEQDIDADTIFIGHSLGAAFALRLIGQVHQTMRSCFLIAPVWEVMGNEFDPLMTTFTVPSYDWKRLLEHCPAFEIFQSDNDPYIRTEKSQTLAQNLSAVLTMLPGAGHFNATAGYREFPQLRNRILTA